MPGSYRIILGDTCTICRAVSRITFPEDRPPQLPIAGCRDADGCRCKLPVFAPSGEDPEVEAVVVRLAQEQAAETAPLVQMPVPVREESPAPVAETLAPTRQEVPAQPVETPAPRRAPEPDWTQPAAITQRRRHALNELKELHRQQRIQGIRILTAPGCCDVCAEVAESIYEPSIAPPIPIVGCANGWQCRCQYAEEPLPLDERGRQAMLRLDRLERERELRRAGIAIGGPRALHVVVAIVGAVTAILALWSLAGSGLVALLPVVLGVISAGVAVMAIRRQRPLPSPAWTYVVCGLGVAIVALGPLFGIQPPAGFDFQHLDRIAGLAAQPQFSSAALAQLPLVRQAVAAAGAAIFLLGLVDLVLAPSDSYF